MQASVRINAQTDNVAGVKIPRFERVMTGASDTKMHLTGLGKGGQQVQQCRKVRRTLSTQRAPVSAGRRSRKRNRYEWKVLMISFKGGLAWVSACLQKACPASDLHNQTWTVQCSVWDTLWAC